ncbi:MAG: hypothetical protein H0U64_07990 [Gemmatimonadaceae bacterium]|nr:hypothetical protein [Gemmatimonadaceae bacterium]
MVSSACKLALFLLLLQGGATVDPDTVKSSALFDGPQRVDGRIIRPREKDPDLVRDVWVVLHRVGSDRAAPLDSMRSRADGSYSFTYTRTGDPEAIYFVAAQYAGIAYFTPPLHEKHERGEHGEIVVFDTTSRNIDIGIRGHHVIISSANASQMRSVTEVFELANDSANTLVGSNGLKGSATWATRIPAQAAGFRVGQGDVPSAAVTVADGTASVFAPLAPGLRQLSFTYMLPGSAFPISFPLDRPVSVLEVLLEDPEGSVDAPKLKEVDPVSFEQRQFRRFLGAEVPAIGELVIDVPRAEKSMNRTFIVLLTLVIGGAMLAALARAFSRK